MRRSGVFWGVALILLGLLFLLDNLGIFAVSVWGLFWPVLLIAIGLWVLWGVLSPRPALALEQVSIPLGGATAARVRMQHGAGRLEITGSSLGAELLSGMFRGGLEYQARQGADGLDVDMRPAADVYRTAFFPFRWRAGDSLDWQVRLNSGLPLQLEIDTGASAAKLDLLTLHVTELRLSTGASATDIWMPAGCGHTRATVKSGAAAVNIRVPESVAARVRVQSGLAGVTVSRRFARGEGGYESPDYATAANKLELFVETGVGAVDIR